jgi:Arc/MetJ-type ribon-helix-helix transcriptional regulator
MKVSKMNKNLRITIRVEESERQKIERLVETGRFRSLSQVIRVALSKFLNENA